MNSSVKIAFIGLGRMGWHMAAHLDHDVTVYDIAADVTQRWVAGHGGRAAAGIAQAVQGAEIVITSLPADKELRAVLAEVKPVIAKDVVWIDHSTTSAQVAREVAADLAAGGAYFLDAPVSGGVDGAKAGSLTVMVGGEEQALSKAEPVIASYAGLVTLMGPSGAGQISKMTNQICVIGLCQALAEGLDFASRAGLNVDNLVRVMLQGSSASWQMQNRADKMLAGDYDFGFSTALMRKDLGLVLEEAKAMKIPLPVTEQVGEFLGQVSEMGGEQWDWCSLMERQRATSTDN